MDNDKKSELLEKQLDGPFAKEWFERGWGINIAGSCGACYTIKASSDGGQFRAVASELPANGSVYIANYAPIKWPAALTLVDEKTGQAMGDGEIVTSFEEMDAAMDLLFSRWMGTGVTHG